MKTSLGLTLFLIFASISSIQADDSKIVGQLGCLQCTHKIDLNGEYNCEATIKVKTEGNRFYHIDNTFDFPDLFGMTHDKTEKTATVSIKAVAKTKTLEDKNKTAYKITSISAASIEIDGKIYKPKVKQ